MLDIYIVYTEFNRWDVREVKEGVLRTPAEKRAGSIPAPTIIFSIPIEQLNIRKSNSSDHDGVPRFHSDLNALLFY